MKTAQRGLTLIELLVAMALTAVIGVLLAALVNGWVKVRERLDEPGSEPQVLEFCLALERRFDTLVLRQLYEQRLPEKLAWLDWQPASGQLQWVALTAWPPAQAHSRVQRQRLLFDARQRRLSLFTSVDLYAAGKPRWELRESLAPIDRAVFSFYQGTRWLAFPSTVAAQPNRGVRIEFEHHGAPYVCTFALPDTQP
ncbi:PulJ/GspJ family protein [Pseudomonas mucidolens]|uniref:Type II secretion system protein J (GspJ) n=1 Tax=Pseudomonas mucidolens TaxID=46679 RepID=A0A1H2MU16_9PSED|nr:prepilin-type N-terminal cleavage/methylation domain-containing protein [Pseudomonas mucidolens]SDU96700.1 type II secretion system protein J (GspJ) [Pseudomonas mucidolens]SQH33222.1 type II secretion system protein J [Pseudomonas mucidolens]